MSDTGWKLTFDPLLADVRFERYQKGQAGGGAGGTITSGALTLPSGVSFEIRDGLAMTGEGEVSLLADSELLVTT